MINELNDQFGSTTSAPLSATAEGDGSDDGLTIDVGAGLSTAPGRNLVTGPTETTEEPDSEPTNAGVDAYYAIQFADSEDSEEDNRDRSDWLNDLFASDLEGYL